MSNAENHTRSWSLADVKKYLKGELSAVEMHQMEKAALDDPFLADALEGLASREPAPREQDLAELKARLDSRVAPRAKRVLLLFRVKVAAAVILLAGLGFTAYFSLRGRKSQPPSAPATAPSIAKSRPLAPANLNTPSAAVADSTKLQESGLAANPTPPPAVSQPPPDRVRKARVIADRRKKADTPATADQRTVDLALQPTTSSSEMFRHDSQPYPLEARAPAYFEPPRQSALLFSGRVLDFKDRPLAGATLSLNGYTQPTVTDNQGMFKLYVPTQDTGRRLTIALTGYRPASYALRTEDLTGNIIRLRENQSSLQEVVINGFGAKRTETRVAAASAETDNLDSFWTKATPVIGRIAYMDYLQTAKKNLGLDSAISGTERISFIVDSKGTPADFRIEQSLSPAHDAGVIRLISAGSSWLNLHGKKTRVVVSVSFP